MDNEDNTNENNNDKNNEIYTDVNQTRYELQDSFKGFTHWHDNYSSQGKYFSGKDVTILVGLDKYANKFYNLIVHYLDDYIKDLGKENVKKIKSLFSSDSVKTQGTFIPLDQDSSRENKFDKDDFSFMRYFFGKFMHVSGLSDLSIQKIDSSADIRDT